jgi:ketosteroid isomerase-like protein
VTKGSGPIEALLSKWSWAWSNRDPQAILSLWDNSDVEATYLPAERHDPLIGLTAVSDYVNSMCAVHDQVQHRIKSPICRLLSNKTGLAFYSLDWMVRDKRGPIGGTYRVTAVWHKSNGRWRLFHYAEAPLAPLLELQSFYESVAAEGLKAIPARTQPL